MSEWQPIASAPRDGQPVLVFVPDWECAHVAGWVEGGWVIAIKRTDFMRIAHPTHWMPLPPPPETTS